MKSLTKILSDAAKNNLSAQQLYIETLLKTIVHEYICNTHLITYINLFDIVKNDWVGESGIIFYSDQFEKEIVKKDLENLRNTLGKQQAQGLREYIFERGVRQFPIILIKKNSKKKTNYSKELNEILFEVSATEAGAKKIAEKMNLVNYKNEFKINFDYFVKNHFAKTWEYIYYFVSPVVRSRAVSGVSIFVEKKITEEKLFPLIATLDSFFAHLDLILIEIPLREYSLRSAIASIFARNYSHNIGSHVDHRTSPKQIKNRITELYNINFNSL